MELCHSLRGTDGEESVCIPRGNKTAWGFMDISAIIRALSHIAS